MRKFLKWTGIIILCIIVIAAIFVLIKVNKFNKMADETFTARVPAIPIIADSAHLARGMCIASSICISCHGGDFSGTKFFSDPKLGQIAAPNITPGGKTKNYSDTDWIRTIRFGVKPDGHGIFIMPCENLNLMSDDDLASLIAFMKTVPASDKKWEAPHLTVFAKFLAGMGAFGTMYHAEEINLEDASVHSAPPAHADAAYGEYVLNFHGCRSCHGASLNGAQPQDPHSPVAPNITPGGHPGKWSEEQFINTLQTGTTPEGKSLDNAYMPWRALGLMSPVELQAVYIYLSGLTALPDGVKQK